MRPIGFVSERPDMATLLSEGSLAKNFRLAEMRQTLLDHAEGKLPEALHSTRLAKLLPLHIQFASWALLSVCDESLTACERS